MWNKSHISSKIKQVKQLAGCYSTIDIEEAHLQTLFAQEHHHLQTTSWYQPSTTIRNVQIPTTLRTISSVNGICAHQTLMNVNSLVDKGGIAHKPHLSSANWSFGISPESMMTTRFLGFPLYVPAPPSIAKTVSIPWITLPKATCSPSNLELPMNNYCIRNLF